MDVCSSVRQKAKVCRPSARVGVWLADPQQLRKTSDVPVCKDHLGRCYLEGRAGDAANVILSAVGHNVRRFLAWLREILACSWDCSGRPLACPAQLYAAS